MRIAVGSDHRGDEGAASLTEHLEAAGHEVSVLASCGGSNESTPVSPSPVSLFMKAGLLFRIKMAE